MSDLLTLQNRLKRDPEGYRDEFLQQVRHFLTNLQIFKSQPLAKAGRADGSGAPGGQSNGGSNEQLTGTNTLQSRRIQEFCALIAFLSHTCALYKEETSKLNIVPELYALLSTNTEMLDPLLRKTLVQSLILLQKRGLVNRIDLFNVLFPIFKCADKELRSFVFNHVINDLQKLASTAPSISVTTELQRVIFGYMKDDHINLALKATHVLVELWKRNVWVGDKVVNQIASMIFTPHDKLISAALYFFLGDYDTSSQEEEQKRAEQLAKNKDVSILKYSIKHTKRKMKKQRELDRTKKAVARAQKQLEEFDDEENVKDAKTANINPLMYIHDPQHFAERLFYKLKVSKETFQTRMLIMDVLSKLIGFQKLLLFNFYPFLQRYLQPHQRHVTVLLSYVIRATHNLVPPEVLRPVVKTIANGFVNDKSGPEVITVGINSIRELCSRAPLVMTEELLHDLVEYKGHKNKGIMSATRSLLNVFRELNPELLKKRDRGKDARVKLAIMKNDEDEKDKFLAKLEYGAQYVHRDVVGADLLREAGLLDERGDSDDDNWASDVDVNLPDDDAEDDDEMNDKEDGEFDWSQWEVDGEGEGGMMGMEGDEGEFDFDDGEGEFDLSAFLNGEGEFDFDDMMMGDEDDEEEEETTTKTSKKAKQSINTMNNDELEEAMLAEFGDAEGEFDFDGEGEMDLDALFADEDFEESEEEEVVEEVKPVPTTTAARKIIALPKINVKKSIANAVSAALQKSAAAKQETAQKQQGDDPLQKDNTKRQRTSMTTASDNELVQLAPPQKPTQDKYKPAGAVRILTPADFKKIEVLKQRQREQKIGNRRGLSSLVEDLEEQADRIQAFKEHAFVDIDDGELQSGHVKKQRLEKEERVKAMREHKRAIRLGMVGNNNQVTQRQITTEEKSKKKVFAMLKHSRKVKAKQTESFKAKQKKSSDHVKSLRNMKKNLRKKVSARKKAR